MLSLARGMSASVPWLRLGSSVHTRKGGALVAPQGGLGKTADRRGRWGSHVRNMTCNSLGCYHALAGGVERRFKAPTGHLARQNGYQGSRQVREEAGFLSSSFILYPN